ncbi:hypothetical protein [Halobacillus amylolyticus]|nr:hypothetical protein [Halobacillus amylolyticus]
MARICEICGRIQEIEEDNLPEKTYDILDVCDTCTEDHGLGY